MPHDVSLILPSYNGAAFIDEALESAQSQTSLPAEIIVVDDDSTDDTRGIVARRAERGPVRWIGLERNSGGPARPLNVGIAAARGELIAVLDQDDLLAPAKLERQRKALAEWPECDFAFSLCASLAEPHVMLQPSALLADLGIGASPPGEVYRLSGPLVLRELVRQGNFIYGYPAVMFRKAALAKGGLDETLRIASDYDLFCWFCTQGDVAFLPEILYWKRFHADNLCYAPRQARREVCRVQRRYVRREPWLANELGLGDRLYRQFGGRLGLPRAGDAARRTIEGCKSVLRNRLPAPLYAKLRAAWRGKPSH